MMQGQRAKDKNSEVAGKDKPEVTASELGSLVLLQNELLSMETPKEVMVFMCNQLHRLTPYFQSISWHRNRYNRIRVMSVSGVSQVDNNATIIVFLQKLVRRILRKQEPQRSALYDASMFKEHIAHDWQEQLPPCCRWLPFVSSDGEIDAGLMVFYESEPDVKSQMLIEPLLKTATHVWYQLDANKKKRKSFIGRFTRSRVSKYLFLIAVAAILSIPVTESSLAPAEIVAKRPDVISSSIHGVVQAIHVEPNQLVEKGDLLVSLDATQYLSDLDIAQKELETAQTKFRILSQQAFTDDEAKAEASLLESDVESAKLRVAQAQLLVDRTRIFAKSQGKIIFNDAYEYLGQPVVIGERIMLLANVQNIELEIRMPVGDTIDFNIGDKVRMFLNTDPTRPIEAELTQTSFEPTHANSGDYVFIMKARILDETLNPRIGWGGTAKVYGSKKISLFMYLFRRPISSLRRLVGI